MKRRQLLRGAAATGLAGLALPTAGAAAERQLSLEFTNPRDELYATVKMTSNLDDGVKFPLTRRSTLPSLWRGHGSGRACT